MQFQLLVIIIVCAIIFDYINGFHDAANSIATIVSTKVLTPFQAVLWAAAFNFLAYFVVKDHKVANYVAKIVVEHISAVCLLLAEASRAERIATSVLPKPTSPQTILSIGFSLLKSFLMSSIVCSWSGVSSYINPILN